MKNFHPSRTINFQGSHYHTPCSNPSRSDMQPTTPDTDSLTSRRLPSLFLPHGSPPIPIEPCISSEYLSSLASTLPIRPKGIVFVSPHWITEGTFEVSTANKPETIYDFDADTDVEAVEKLRRLSYPTPGAPDLGEYLTSDHVTLRPWSLTVPSSPFPPPPRQPSASSPSSFPLPSPAQHARAEASTTESGRPSTSCSRKPTYPSPALA